ncbi:helix-turn-helix domain-containing protein [Microbacterium sp.]|uniref:helix-turn-helix domain-containing protein n=2 Tax=Microbacterium sp. TaxID=51671 RepID=UPI00373512DC
MSNDFGRLLTVMEAADSLNVTPRMVRKLVETRALPSVKIGRLVRIAPDALASYARAQTRGDS